MLVTSINQKEDAPIKLIQNGKEVSVPFQLKKGDDFIVSHSFDCKKPRCVKICGEELDS